MVEYINLLKKVLQEGKERTDRTGVGTVSVFGTHSEYDLTMGFPLLTTKKMFWKGIVGELLWIIKGQTNIKHLTEHNIHIWDEWADENGDLGPVYGHQLRNWNSQNVDQLQKVIRSLREDPYSRRHVITLWNPAQEKYMRLPPCHGIVIQFYVSDDNMLSCSMYQRSADVFLGVPFNIASYSLLTCLIGLECGYKPNKFIHIIGDCHIYKNHIEQVKTQIQRTPYPLPDISITKVDNIDKYTLDHIHLHNYSSHPPIKGEIAV